MEALFYFPQNETEEAFIQMSMIAGISEFRPNSGTELWVLEYGNKPIRHGKFSTIVAYSATRAAQYYCLNK